MALVYVWMEKGEDMSQSPHLLLVVSMEILGMGSSELDRNRSHRDVVAETYFWKETFVSYWFFGMLNDVTLVA
jgi:hypothetical protein